MSNRVKKSPVWTDNRTPGTRWSKRQASKAVRRLLSDIWITIMPDLISN